jgi:hypothetical protein
VGEFTWVDRYSRRRWRVGMTERRDEDRERTRREQEDDVRRQEDRERRFEELREAWRRHHPSEPEEGGKDRPKKGRPT